MTRLRALVCEAEKVRVPDVIVYRERAEDRSDAVACAMASDWHIEEPVDPGAINGLNHGLRVLPADSLYLAWMDCRGLGMDAAALHRFLLTRARVWLDKGPKFGAEGHGYARVNLACPRATVDEAIGRLKAAVASL